MYDPIKRTKQLEKFAVLNEKRKYYRFRAAKWYGGIATADVVVCNLLCKFCWAGDEIRNFPNKVGKFYTPKEVFNKLDAIARKKGYKLLRLSGQEPTIGKEHLLKLLEIIDKTNYYFILETNGILIGNDLDYANSLSNYKNLHVRVSIKGTNESEYSILTDAIPESFNLQIKALENLIDAKVSCHASLMSLFSSKNNFIDLVERLSMISPMLEKNLEIEELILYPHVKARLKKNSINITRVTPNIVVKMIK